MKLLTNSKPLLEALNEIEITTSEQLLLHLPYRYEDNGYTDENEELKIKKRVVLYGRLVSNPVCKMHHKLSITIFHFVSIFSNRFYKVIAYNRPYLSHSINLEENYTLIATVQEKIELNFISAIKGQIDPKERLRPLYHLPRQIGQKTFFNLIKKTIVEQNLFFNQIPLKYTQKYRLLSYKEALFKVHLPENEEDIRLGLRTLKYIESLNYSLKNYLIRHENQSLTVSKRAIDTQKINQFVKQLPFTLTKDQLVAIREVILDMNSSHLMYRLLQGDVGSGKTIVAFIALYGNFLRGQIGAFMAPTDSLSRQHFQSIKEAFKGFPLRFELLLGSLSIKEKKRIKDAIANGEVDVVVGTHSLFTEDVIYPDLGLAIIDEQHRFGVNQRNYLLKKGEHADLLLMSATPIPRTLSLAIYGSLAVSTLYQFPFSKRSVKTVLLDYNDTKIFEYIDEARRNNRKIFVVAPKIESSDEEEVNNVKDLFEIYQKKYQEEVAILHGKIKSKEKAEILENFMNRDINILIATSVIEVGIDCQKAGLMIIYHANSFGLASLHQLRGRIGRDGKEATCILVADLEVDQERLEFLCQEDDGFKVAEQDMAFRGPGDILGLKQSGIPHFSALNIVTDHKVFATANQDALEIINHLEDEDNNRYYQKIKQENDNEKELVLFD